MVMALSRRALLIASAGAAAALLLAAPRQPAEAQGTDVLVFAAASLKTALDAVNAQWRTETGKKAVISYAASSALAKQIEQGAPAQVFISADLDWMDYLAGKSLIKPDTRSNLLGNRIVLIAPKDKAQPIEIEAGFDLAEILGDGRLAMANVDAVPAGKYGKAALEKLGVWASVANKTAQAENVRAALLLVSRGEAPAGIVYRDGRRGRPKRQDHRHVSGEHAPADRLSHSPDGQCHAPRCRGIPRLHQVGEGQAAVRGAGLRRAEPGAILTHGARGHPPMDWMALGPEEWTAVRLSLKVAVVATLVSLPFGIAIAMALARGRFWGQSLLNGLVLLPLILPPVVTGYMLLLLFGRRGADRRLSRRSFGIVFAFRWTGAALACGVMGFPLLVRAIRLSIEAVDRRLEEAAGTLGANRAWVFRR